MTGGAGSTLATNNMVFNAVTGTFVTGTSMPTNCPGAAPRGEHELVAHGGRLYAVAGACPFFGSSINNLDALKVHP